MKLTHVHFQNFKSLRNATLILNDGFTALVGGHGTGKTVVLDALAIVVEAHDGTLDDYLAQYKSSLFCNGTADEDIELELWFDDHDSIGSYKLSIFHSGTWLAEFNGSDRMCQKMSAFIADIEFIEFTDNAKQALYRHLLSTKETSPNPNRYERLCHFIRLVDPAIQDLCLRESKKGLELYWRDTNGRIHPEIHISQKTLEAFFVYACIQETFRQPPALVCIDNFTDGLDISTASVLLDQARSWAIRGSQILSVTTPTSTLDLLTLPEIQLSKKIDGQSTFYSLSETDLSGWLEEYSLLELWEKNVLQTSMCCSCGHETRVQISSGICERPTFGHGKLDNYGYWEIPCYESARQWEQEHSSEAWPAGLPLLIEELRDKAANLNKGRGVECIRNALVLFQLGEFEKGVSTLQQNTDKLTQYTEFYAWFEHAFTQLVQTLELDHNTQVDDE